MTPQEPPLETAGSDTAETPNAESHAPTTNLDDPHKHHDDYNRHANDNTWWVALMLGWLLGAAEGVLFTFILTSVEPAPVPWIAAAAVVPPCILGALVASRFVSRGGARA